MENKLNIAELLKDCPSGTKLYSPLCGECRYQGLEKRYNEKYTKIVVKTEKNGEIWFNEYGKYFNDFTMDECLIFPSKENRDWSTFQRPFKDGDVVFYDDNIAIFKEWGDETLFRTYVTKYLCRDSLIDKNVPLFGKYIRKNTRLATEEEKQKLFDAIKANGYKWNSETKTLEKLPKFKVGDRVKHKDGYFSGVVTEINGEYFRIEYNSDAEGTIDIRYQDEYELVSNKFDITTLKPFESRVLVRSGDNSLWKPAIFGYYVQDAGFFALGGTCWMYCIPFENNEHLLSTTDDCDEYYKTWE